MGGGVDPHTHQNGDQDHCHFSAKYQEYIKIHLANLQTKCLHLTICINELLAGQRVFSVLKGDNIKLSRICQLMNVKSRNSSEMLWDGKCSNEDRWDVKEDVEAHIRDKMEKRSHWEDVSLCLENSYGDDERSTYVQEICGLAEKQDKICNNYNTHKHVERFVNEQVQHLQCTCNSLQRDHGHSHNNTPLLIGAGVGGFLFLCLLLVVVCMCYRRKKNRQKERPSVIYVPTSGSECPVYQEVFDQRSPPLSPPSLPSRYVSRPLPGQPPDDDYLEPIQARAGYQSKAPAPLQRMINNPSYDLDAPPKYSETDQMYEDAIPLNSEPGTYFEPIATPKDEKEGGGYDTIEHAKSGETTQSEEGPLLNSNGTGVPDVDRPLGPKPADRKKKDERVTESEYFELEKEDGM